MAQPCIFCESQINTNEDDEYQDGYAIGKSISCIVCLKDLKRNLESIDLNL